MAMKYQHESPLEANQRGRSGDCCRRVWQMRYNWRGGHDTAWGGSIGCRLGKGRSSMVGPKCNQSDWGRKQGAQGSDVDSHFQMDDSHFGSSADVRGLEAIGSGSRRGLDHRLCGEGPNLKHTEKDRQIAALSPAPKRLIDLWTSHGRPPWWTSCRSIHWTFHISYRRLGRVAFELGTLRCIVSGRQP